MLDAGINLNQPLFEGFKVQTNYKRLNELKTIGELNTRLEVENFIANLAAEYFNYVQQNIRLNNLKYTVQLSEERLRIVEARYQIGSLSRLDFQQAKVDFNADSSLLIQQYEILNASRIKLNELMGVENVEQPFVTEDTLIYFNADLSKDKLYESMLSENTLLKLVEKDKVLSELDLKTLQSQNYPYLKLNAEYGFTHYDYNTGTIDKQRNWGPVVGVTLGFNVFNGFNRKREQKNARIAIENRQLAIEKQKLSLKSNFANMWMAYQNNIELTKLEYESLENARINYEIAIDRYKLGDLSGLELREAQNSLLEAGQRLVSAQYRTKLYEISLLQISGKIEKYLQ
ncbi:MAG TPA: TolC family protein [Dysgonamonadaceae bacterium]|jgi:outer membrane protein TolC|nr:TolC family protein [Dysgonamonadaceae bacterium]